MIVNGKRTSLEDFTATLKKLKTSGYFITIGVLEETSNLLISATKTGKVIDNKTFGVLGMTPSTLESILNIAHTWDYITPNISTSAKIRKLKQSYESQRSNKKR